MTATAGRPSAAISHAPTSRRRTVRRTDH
jgi:hypothetical protein